MDGHFGETGSFVYNLKLAKWEAPSDRLDYYRGHRAGSDARREEWSGHASKEVGAGSHLRDGVSWVWPGGMCWDRSLAARAVKANSEAQEEGAPKALAHDAGIRSWRFLAKELTEKRRKTTRRQRWTRRR